MRQFFKKIHLWLSIPTGLIISIICITGAILSFDTEILELCYPEHYYVKSVGSQTIPLDKLVPIVNSQLDTNSVAAIKVYADPKKTYTATLTKGFRVSAFIDPYTGKITGYYYFRDGFFFKVMSLHRWLMDGSQTWGKYTVGISTLLFICILISGVVWWLPIRKKKIKHKFTVKTRYGIKRFLHDIHSVVGMYACLFLLVCSLTGLMWSFEWCRNTVAKFYGVETIGSNNKKNKPQRGEKQKQTDSRFWQVALENIRNQAPDNEYISISDKTISVLDKNAFHLRALDKYSFDERSGNITRSELYADQKSMSKIMGWAYALHAGYVGGILVRILTCLACIIGGTLPLTGYYIYYRKSKSRKE